MSKVLVTGASGFIGQKLLRRLMASGDHVVAVTRSALFNEQVEVPGVSGECTRLKFDFASGNLPAVTFSGVHTVYHLAGLAHDLAAVQDHDMYYQINTRATLELARQAEKSGVQEFVFVSSVKASGDLTDDECGTEENQQSPKSVYAQSKLEAEQGLLQLARTSRMKIVIVRPALVYGPGVKGNLESMLSAIKRGWFPPLPDTQNRRSLVHVNDLVRSLLFLARHESSDGQVYIVTDGQLYTSRQIYESMCLALSKKVPSWGVPARLIYLLGRISTRLNSKIEKLLGSECYSSDKLQKLGFISEHTIWSPNSWS